MVIEHYADRSSRVFRTECDYQVYKYAFIHFLCNIVQTYRNFQRSCNGGTELGPEKHSVPNSRTPVLFHVSAEIF